MAELKIKKFEQESEERSTIDLINTVLNESDRKDYLNGFQDAKFVNRVTKSIRNIDDGVIELSDSDFNKLQTLFEFFTPPKWGVSDEVLGIVAEILKKENLMEES